VGWKWGKGGVGGSSYEKVIVAVLACHGGGRVWERATAAGGTRGTGGSGRQSWRVEAAVVYRQTASSQGRTVEGDEGRS
jgi:hypothetical protein